jgi:phosphatidylserine synthase
VGIRKILKKESYTNATFFKILGAIASGIAISIGLMGILFKTLRWPGSIQMLIFGLASLLVISIISTIKLISSKQKYYSVVLKRIIPVLLIVAFYFAMPKYFLVELRYGKNPAYYKAIENYEQNRNDTLLDKK